MTVPVLTQRLEVGDRLRFSTALLRQIHEGPDHESELVELVEVRIEEDGSKVLVVKRVDV